VLRGPLEPGTGAGVVVIERRGDRALRRHADGGPGADPGVQESVLDQLQDGVEGAVVGILDRLPYFVVAEGPKHAHRLRGAEGEVVTGDRRPLRSRQLLRFDLGDRIGALVLGQVLR
jgi:hypothetical protein